MVDDSRCSRTTRTGFLVVAGNDQVRGRDAQGREYELFYSVPNDLNYALNQALAGKAKVLQIALGIFIHE